MNELQRNPGYQTLDHLTDKVKEYITQAKSLNTRRAYRSDWADFESWCAQHNLCSMPAESATVAAYVSDRASTHKVSSLERRLVAIRQAHAMAGIQFNKGDPLIINTMQGIRKTHGTAQVGKAPILLEDLKSMIENLDNSMIGFRDKALLLLGFTGAFRRSEIVGLQLSDLKFTNSGYEVILRKSKTDQTGEGYTLPIPYGSNPYTCPVRAIQAWLHHSQIKDGPIFRSVGKNGLVSEKALSPIDVARIIKRNTHTQESGADFSGHSLRAGFCTQAATKGVPEHAIMRQSRHKKSDTLKKYIRIANMWQDCAATKLGL